MIQVNRIYLIFNRLVTKKFLVDTSDNMNQKTDFNSNVVVVQPIDKGMVDMLNAQDDLYHVNLQGLDKGETINSLTMIDVISRALNPYTQNDEFMKLAEQPEMRFVISNTTEAGIAFDPACKLTGVFLSGQTDTAVVSPLQDIQRRQEQRTDYLPLRTHLPEWPQVEGDNLSIH